MPLLLRGVEHERSRDDAPVGALLAPRPEPDPYADPVLRAVVDLTVERGYGALTLSAVARRAGIETAELEARFADPTECMLAALDGFMADFVWRAESAYATGSDWREGLRACAWAVADLIAAEPAIVRVVAVELLAAGEEMLRVAREEVLMYGARVIERGRAEAADPDAVPEGAAAMAMGSIAQLITHRLQKGDPLAAHETVRELIYLSVRPYLGEEVAIEELGMPRPSGSRLDPPTPRPSRDRVPPRPEIDPFSDPVSVAVVELIDEMGYESVTEEAIARRAGIAEEEFRRRFEDKQDCVRATVAAFGADYEWTVETAYATGADWREGLRASAYATADYMDAQPALLRMVMIGLLRAKGEGLRVLREESLSYGVKLIDRGRVEAPDPAAIPRGAGKMAMGSIAQFLTIRLSKGEDIAPHEIAPQLLYMAVRPYAGEQAAREELRLPRPPGSYVRR